MKMLKRALLLLVAVAAIAMLLFLYRMTQSVSVGLHLQRLTMIRGIDNLDVELDRAVTQARGGSLSAESDNRAQITQQIGDAMDALDHGPHSLKGLNPAVDKALDTFINTMDDKAALGFDFIARDIQVNQRLGNSLQAVAPLSTALLAQADPSIRGQLQPLLDQLDAEAVNYAVTPVPTNGTSFKQQLADLQTLTKTQPQAVQDAVQQLANQCGEVMADKDELVRKLNDFLGRPTAPQLQAVEKAYNAWHESQLTVANRYRQYLAAYAAILLLGLAWLGIRLNRSFRELDRANETLEAQVQERTADLSRALKDLRSSQSQLVQSEKMASLGQMVAGVAHEINTPLGYARSNTEIVRSSLTELRELCLVQGKALKLMTSEDTSVDEAAQAFAEAQERAATLNPAELGQDLDNLLGDADHGLTQIAELVASLKDFSRVDRSRSDVLNINDSIDSSLKICNNLLKNRIEVVKAYAPELPPIECSPSQLNQVFLNLFTNAAQAIDGEGKIFIHTLAEDNGVVVRIVDTGTGMPESVRTHIFEPFFTTKPVGKGTGLGLSIVYRIIQDHGGSIEVLSTPGKGSEFTVRLPLRQKHAAPAEHEQSQLAPPGSYMPALAPA